MEQQRRLEELRQESHPHACLDGHVYLGIIRLNEETGEEEEVISKTESQRIPQRWFPAPDGPEAA